MFVATRHHVDFFTLLCKKLRIKCGGCYGSMDQEAREFQLMRFKQRRVKVMVVTDVAARGLDIDDLEVVLNYDFPTSHRILVHRAGRTARLERAGLCLSLITENDLPYAVEQLLHVGRPASMAEMTFDKPDKFYTGEEGVTVLGSVGDTGIEQEMVDVAMKFDDISTSYKSVLNSYKLYDRTRPAPSKPSIRKARQFTKEAGGFQKMMEVIHPYIRARVLRATVRSTPEDLERKSHYLASIEAYRPNFDDPKLTKQSARVLSAGSTQAMRRRKFSTNLQEYSLKRRDPTRSTICSLSISRSALEGLACKPRRKSEPELVQPRPVDVGDDPLLDAFSDDDMADEAGNVVTVSKGAGSLMCSGVTVIADDDNEMRQQRHVMRWNAKNKKYQMVLLDEDGQVVKGRKNEAGQIVKSEVAKKGLYKKWMGQSRLSIQKSGERENKYAASTEQAKPGDEEYDQLRPSLLGKKPLQRVRGRFMSNGKVLRRHYESTVKPEKQADSGDEIEPLPLSQLTRNQGLVEKIEKGLPLSAKESKHRTRLMGRQADSKQSTRGESDFVPNTRKRKKSQPSRKKSHSKRRRTS
ncbi:MAG: hypothetical protein KVP17_003415 [Porospora cf. gigantea B]|uniref:uncharacterized protein n=1 Tax=Porospora cf. gigantea B TaxID=2853592 RepID=UPI003571F33B|nr:MAG: hypothetical protein KVP17_003415 [Porospora cf. gigantea B]